MSILDWHNRSCAILSCFYSLCSYPTENIATVIKTNHWWKVIKVRRSSCKASVIFSWFFSQMRIYWHILLEKSGESWKMRADRQTDRKTDIMNLIGTFSKPKHPKMEIIIYKIFGILKTELIVHHSDVFIPKNLRMLICV